MDENSTPFHRQRINPLDMLRMLGLPRDHITFDPTLKRGKYYIARGGVHDGTLWFTHDILAQALRPLALQESYCKRDEVDFDRQIGCRYRVGWLRLARVFGMVELPCSTTQLYPGVRERVRIHVVPDYVYP